MSEAAFTSVQNPSGPVNSGSGTQNNYLHFHQVVGSAVRVPVSPPLSHAHLEWLGHRFVPPRGMRTAALALGAERTVLIDAPPGSGRDTAARMLLKDLPDPHTARRLLPEDDGAGFALSGDHVGDADRLLLDLSDLPHAVWTTLQRQLPVLLESVREHRAYLVVILPHGAPVGDELVIHRVTIERPDAMRVLMRTLRAEEVPDVLAPEQLAPAVHAFLAGRPALSEVAQLAPLIGEARRADPGAKPEQWSSAALERLVRPGDAVAEQVRKLTDGGQRALLLTAAMLPGARVEVLHHAHQRLLTAVAHPRDDRPVFEHDDLSERLDRVDVTVRPDGSVEFRRPGLAPAVRDHFWTNRPDLWDVFRRWVDALLRLPGLSDRNRDELVAAFAEQMLRLGQQGQLLDVARLWSRRDEPPLLQAAVQVLGHALSDPLAGRAFRKHLYEWSRDTRMDVWTARVLVAVSADEIATSHPDQALVRLHHLARGGSGQASGADDRLVRLARTDARLYRKLLDRLARGLARHSVPADARLFRAAVAPPVLLEAGTGSGPLLDDARTRDTLTTAWHALIAASGPHAWLGTAEEWLAAARPGDDRGPLLLGVLVRAAAPLPDALDRLYVASLRHPCASEVRRLVDAVQGVVPAPERLG